MRSMVETTIREVCIGEPKEFEVTLKTNLRTSTASMIVVHRGAYKKMGSPKSGDKLRVIMYRSD